MNLIINARDAMPEGGTITVTAENRTVADPKGGLAPGDYVVLTVSDSGCGIAPELLEQVMEPFFTTKEVGKGTGLGLSMVYGFARQSGGLFRLSSTIGVGTRAQLWLPRGITTGEPVVEVDAHRVEAAPARPLRILVVDDHEGVRTTTAALLADLGHEAVEATDGAAVMALLRSEPDGYDLLITDYAMPRMSGAEVIRQARAVSDRLPAIIITGYADAQSIARRPEGVAVLAKPFTPDQALAAIRAATAENSPSEPLRAAS